MGNNIEKGSFFDKLKSGLTKTRKVFLGRVEDIFLGKKIIDQTTFEELEEALITADIGPSFTYELIEKMKEQVNRKDLNSPDHLTKILRDSMTDILKKSESPLEIPVGGLFTVMVIGVNGTGKTTTIGKIAHHLKNKGRSVMLVAADTFRAAAIDQLDIWGQRVGVPVMKQQPNSDPSAVVFDALQSAKSGKAQVIIVDTAGRLHTKTNLMEELKKMKRIMAREIPGAPHEILLVLDATNGQNAIAQAKMFKDDIGITGIVLTKLDGTSKGGVIIRISSELNLPLRYIGVGEGLDDLRPFDSKEFIDALFEKDSRR
jgi:fused signal recognition particle receptor